MLQSKIIQDFSRLSQPPLACLPCNAPAVRAEGPRRSALLRVTRNTMDDEVRGSRSHSLLHLVHLCYVRSRSAPSWGGTKKSKSCGVNPISCSSLPNLEYLMMFFSAEQWLNLAVARSNECRWFWLKIQSISNILDQIIYLYI